ncbi:MAG TPA: fumarylacetoacetate hydrolase family protein [Acetomicrobium flavidum]|uniref:fumarylacetoacetate hydrolase family protein n=1 Tax=Acetomicrobium flavidum TaxID=49896 RepID=UPI002CC65A9A|nr:fumarylacetoacetate hydrolase family protein [Acetomicrobium flavidum]HOP87511.1 fumarylacetoacetate hydrolase family protein [Acetomicrobium flavidum]HPU68711.1 fumarylacetoacetate hydrolase family protein [Acetomicrobium flavidum]
MRIARFMDGKGIVRWGIVEEEEIKETKGLKGPYTGEKYPLKGVRLLAPAEPTKIVCVGKNYVDHIEEMDGEVDQLPKEPGLFLKAPNALADPGEVIPYPHFTNEFHYEGELAVVIAKPMKMVSDEEALNYVLGYTCAFDLTARDAQRKDLQWIRAKSADKFCPLGPWIETDLDPTDLGIKTEVNGQVRQNSRTSLMIFSLKKILSFTSSFMTLLPGDVVLTGTPSGVGELHVGDVAAVTIEGIGTLQISVGH